MPSTPQTPRDQLLAAIAREKLQFPTLEARHMDSLDFRDVGVLSLKAALESAYEAGFAAARAKRRR